MQKPVILDQIKKLCNEINDREIYLDFSYKDNMFHARYLFLGNELYITDTLGVIELKELELEILEKIGNMLNICDN